MKKLMSKEINSNSNRLSTGVKLIPSRICALQFFARMKNERNRCALVTPNAAIVAQLLPNRRRDAGNYKTARGRIAGSKGTKVRAPEVDASRMNGMPYKVGNFRSLILSLSRGYLR